MKKVCIITTVHSPFDVRIFHKQARSLVKAGYKVVLIAPHGNHEIVQGVEIIPLPKSHNRFFRMIRTITAFKLALKHKSDIYHFHDPELILVGLILKIFGKKVIYDAHEDYPSQIITKEWIPASLRRVISVLFDIIERTTARIFDGVISATDSIAERFPVRKTVVVRNFPLVECFTELLNSNRNSSEQMVAIYAGGLTRIRGIKQIVEAFSLIKGVELWLVGEFEDQKFQLEIEGIASSNVRIFGFKPHKEVINLYKKANIGIVCLLPVPNYITSIPNKLFEYMVAGLPVVASNFTLWREFVDGCGVLVNPEDPEDIASAVEKLLSKPEILRKMGENGKRKVLERYNWEQEFLKLLNLYKQILE